MSKEFQKKYIHPTRRKLVDMVFNGEYESAPTVGYTPEAEKTVSRQIGERWKDKSGIEWEQRGGYKVKVSELSDVMSNIRKELSEKNNCKLKGKGCEMKGKISPTNKKLIRQTGYCSSCLAALEHPIRIDGLYIAYENFKLMSNMVKEGISMLEKLEQAYNEAKQVYEYIDADGNTQKWEMERNVDEIKSEIREDINKLNDELSIVKENRKKVYELLKDKNYTLVNELIEE